MSLDELDNSFEYIHENTTGEKVAKIYIRKAKKEKNIKSLFLAYRYITFYTTSPVNIKYSDSTIILAKKINDPQFIVNGYLNKSEILSMENMFQKSIDQLLMAYKLSEGINDGYLDNKILYKIAENEIYLGNYYEAQKKLKLINKYFKENFNKNEIGKGYSLYYFYSTVLLIDLNTKLGRHSENKSLYKDAYEKIKLDKNYEKYKAYLLSCEGTEAYYNKNYPLAISKLNEAIKQYNDNFAHFTEIYYLGLTYWKLNQKDKAINYFLKLDKEYYKDKNQDPQFRPAYELLIQYYKEKGNTDKQLEYINKLIYLDHSYEKNYKYLFSKINKEYSSEKLVQEKNEIQNSLKFHQLFIIFIVILSFSVITFVFYRYTKIQKEYKQSFREIVSQKNIPAVVTSNLDIISHQNSNQSKTENLYDKIPGLSASTIESILSKLNNFEVEHQFLNSQLSHKSLCEELGTNLSYLSKIINVYKQKNFNQYINDLRLDYIIEKLKTDEKYLAMDVKEIANLAGFTSAESFSDNFKRKFKIKPSLFIKMMQENTKTSFQSHNQALNSKNV